MEENNLTNPNISFYLNSTAATSIKGAVYFDCTGIAIGTGTGKSDRLNVATYTKLSFKETGSLDSERLLGTLQTDATGGELNFYQKPTPIHNVDDYETYGTSSHPLLLYTDTISQPVGKTSYVKLNTAYNSCSMTLNAPSGNYLAVGSSGDSNVFQVSTASTKIRFYTGTTAASATSGRVGAYGIALSETTSFGSGSLSALFGQGHMLQPQHLLRVAL